MKPGTAYGNVNVLDIRKATEASVSAIREIGNANVVISTPKTTPLIPKLNMMNVNCTAEIPDGANAQLVIGKLNISREYFTHQKSPAHLVVLGMIIIEPDVSPDDIIKWIATIVLVGKIICPAPLAGLVNQKISQLLGKTAVYPPFAKVEFSELTLDESYLTALKDKTELAVIGQVIVPDVLPNKLIEQKIAKLHASDEITCHAENAQILQACLDQQPAKMKIIPSGFKLIRQPLRLDSALLDSLPSSKLYCTELVQITTDVEATKLDKQLNQLYCESQILCPEALRSILNKKCDVMNSEVIFYEGELWLLEGSEDLSKDSLGTLPEKVTLVQLGNLNVDSELTPEMLSKQFVKIYNFGDIRCSSIQMKALRACMVLNKGSLIDTTQETHEENWISNINLLTL